MSEQNAPDKSASSVEITLKRELAHGDVIIATAPPILRHLLANVDQALFSDQVIATIRGMMLHLAQQMLANLADVRGISNRAEFIEQSLDEIASALLDETDFLSHAHAITVEATLADRLSRRSGIDPVLSPVLQELVSSTEDQVATGAMHALAAQARFMQQQGRMALPLHELPHDLFERAMQIFREHTAADGEDAAKAEKAMCDAYDPDQRRVAKFIRLVSGMQHRANRALAVDNAGLSIFVTAVSMAADINRDTVIMSLGEAQCARLALSLRAAGLNQSAVEEQFLYLHPEITLPDGFDTIRPDRAVAMLNDAQDEGAH
ncbi:hypothetical protein [Aurantiacibacter sediminis]|uniref:DUF2336 domain-containing protein n=1 Tax=Aurantiacibacter sediminis TaxID=2793064 RepID=A0ABS0N475_9SPHN|nr:hypothetical protein [Aurantiacibacter sediminis]MBH5322713.1 hypothetical protein [Aurantiacibacter sediminis]